MTSVERTEPVRTRPVARAMAPFFSTRTQRAVANHPALGLEPHDRGDLFLVREGSLRRLGGTVAIFAASGLCFIETVVAILIIVRRAPIETSGRPVAWVATFVAINRPDARSGRRLREVGRSERTFSSSVPRSRCSACSPSGARSAWLRRIAGSSRLGRTGSCATRSTSRTPSPSSAICSENPTARNIAIISRVTVKDGGARADQLRGGGLDAQSGVR